MPCKSNFVHIRYPALMASETPPATPPVLHRSLLNRLRYKHLHMLVALGSSLNLHRASIGLAMSQPAATRMLREIEDMFGCQLFERLPRGMRPTALGAQLVRFAEASLNSLDRCAEDLAARRQGGYGYLSIGTIMGAAPDLVMTAVARLKAGNPQLRIRIMGDTSDQVLRLLDQRRIDLAIARRNPSAEGGPTASRNWATSGCWWWCAAAMRWHGAASSPGKSCCTTGPGFFSRPPARRASRSTSCCSAWGCRHRPMSSNAARCIPCSSWCS